MKEKRTLPGAEEVKEKVRIEEVVSRYLSLQRCGHKDTFVGLCPFHDDHRPSLHVDGEKQLFKCFSCDEGGDVISFVMKMEKCSFPEALRMLVGAEDCHSALPCHSEPEGRRTSLPEGRPSPPSVMAGLTRHLPSTQGALNDGRSRVKPGMTEVSEEALTGVGEGRTEVGEGQTGVGNFLSSLPPYEPLHPTLAAVYRDFGVCLAPASVPKEFYAMRGRIVFPIHNSEGQIVALAGRYTGMPSSKIPKYINSENNDLYKKSQTLYALHRAQESIKRTGEVCLVEGYKDCLAMHAGGFTQTVALCGKELTDGQLDLLRPLTNRIILMLDGDEAGRTGAQKIAARLKSSGISVSIAELPDGEDPDSLFWHLGYDEFIRFIHRRIHPAKPEETALLSFILTHRDDTYEVEGTTYTLPALLDHLQQRDYLPFKDRAYQAILAHLTLGHALTLLPPPLWNEVSEIQARHEEETEAEVTEHFHSLYFEYVEARVFGHLFALFSALRSIPAGEERERQLRRIVYRKEQLGTVTEELHRTATGLCGTVSVFLL